ncbi:MAG: hypothetical protein U5K81_13120 [Trueperaceae bacterium]|nr:hypothetical protein [Trueperaceae bacterium]
MRTSLAPELFGQAGGVDAVAAAGQHQRGLTVLGDEQERLDDLGDLAAYRRGGVGGGAGGVRHLTDGVVQAVLAQGVTHAGGALGFRHGGEDTPAVR